MLRLALRNLFQSRTRLLISVGGVALALMLILSLDAIFVGMESQITAYIDSTGADVFVAQSGVQNMHMASSALPASTARLVERVEGVSEVTPIRYVANTISVEEREFIAYVIGVPRGAGMGRPRSVVEGTAEIGAGDAILDGAAARAAAAVGDTVRILGRDFRVAGMSRGLGFPVVVY